MTGALITGAIVLFLIAMFVAWPTDEFEAVDLGVIIGQIQDGDK